MKPTAEHITDIQRDILAPVITSIVKAIDPEKIICYGTRTLLTQAWSSLASPLTSTTDTDYDLLIVAKPGEKRKANEILDIIDKFSTSEIRIIAIVHTLCSVNEALLQGRIFFSTIYHHGVLLYDASGFH